MERSMLAAKSSIMGVISKLLLIAMNFACRFFFIRYIGAEILGLEGVIRDCVSLLSLSDLGISTAMTYRLYSIINEKDYKAASGYLTLYRSAYKYIMLAIATLGIVGSFFLKRIITDVTVSWQYVCIIYFLQIVAVECSYMAAYKRCILNADQKYYVQIEVDTVANLLASIIKIGVIIFTQDYILYICITIAQNLTANLFLSSYVSKNYAAYERQKKSPTKEQKESLILDTKNIIGNKLAGFVYSSTDNVLISAFLGTTLVGYLSNYKLIFSTLSTVLLSFTTPITTLLGNYLNDKNKEDSSFDILCKYSFVRFVFSVLFVVPTVALGQNFIVLYAGDYWLLPKIDLLLLAVDFYISCLYGALGDYSAGLGIFENQKAVSIMGAVINIVLSIVLVRKLGIAGVLVGTVVSQLVLWIGNWKIVNKKLWNSKNKKRYYWSKQLKYVAITSLLVMFGVFAEQLFAVPVGILDFVLKGILIETVSVLFICAIFYPTEEFQYLLNIFKNIINRKHS